MDEKKVREAIYCMKSFADDTVCEECDNYDRCDHTMVADNAKIAIEALEQTAATGNMKTTIAQKLEEVRADIVNIRHMLLTEDTALDQAILSWKKAQLEKWAIFLEDLLSGGVKKTVSKDWKQNVMQRFGRVE